MKTFDVTDMPKVIADMGEIIVYKPIVTLLGDEDSDPVIFCISSVEDSEGKKPKTNEPIMRWKLIIHFITEDDDGDTQEVIRAITLGHSTERDIQMKELQTAIVKSSDGKVHSFRVGVQTSADKSIRKYHLLAVRDNNALMCECSTLNS